ncbi:hypothetical protein OIDMADRAFT_139674 [Oidiodendron maius Zn]|uniref:Enoyl reductase (ER) domain-containing protein n=1 Tax=Oidiodendron maius (strain Zn) TaxID=913774 RepID=A0A0C3HV75_OIDMZ|nr:hypothetical protein OIDMADRAFT_139674 [Oidiodendron maius Zn]
MPSATPSAITTLPTQQTAIVAEGPGKLTVRHDLPVPALGAAQAIVKTAAVAINPADAKMLDYSAAVGAIHGYDFAGTIVALGTDVPPHLSMGDRVAGLAHGGNAAEPMIGGFCEYVVVDADLLFKLPDRMSFGQGASLGTGVGTALLCIFQELGLPTSLLEQPAPPTDHDASFVLVAGGSTATGTRAIQFLKIAGLRPIATSSPANFDLCLRFGAERVFDYRSPTAAADIRTYTHNTLKYAIDCVSQADTTQLCYGAIGRAGGKYVSLEPYRETITATRPTVTPSFAMVLTMFGDKVDLDGVYGREARPGDRRFASHTWAIVQRLLDRGLIQAHPVREMEGGWAGVIKGVDMIRSQAMSGYKLVYGV